MTWAIHQGDCREVLRSLPAESVDACIADPPYGETSLEWDRRVDGWLQEVRRVLKPHGSLWCFGSLRFFMERMRDFDGWRLAQEIVWEKHNGSNAANDRFRRVHELAAHFYPAGWDEVFKAPQVTLDATARTVRRKKRPPQWGDIGASSYASEDGGPRLMRSVFYARSCHGNAIHESQKPTAILEPLIRYSCPPGGVVLDPFAGSGSTIVAALAVGCSAIGIELRPECATAARQHVECATAQGQLFRARSP